MNREEVKEKLVQLCVKIFHQTGIKEDMIECVDFVDDLGMDSLMFISLVIAIEADFEITVPDELLLIKHFKNIASIMEMVTAQLQQV